MCVYTMHLVSATSIITRAFRYNVVVVAAVLKMEVVLQLTCAL